MVPFVDHVERSGRPQGCDYRSKLIGRSERIPRSLNEQHREPNSRQVLCSQFVGLSWWMKGIAEEYEGPRALASCGCDLRSNSPSHRFTADYKSGISKQGLIADRFNHGPEAGFEFFGSIRDFSGLLGVGEIERRGVTPSGGETLGKFDHKPASLRSAGSVTEHDCDRRPRLQRRINKAGYLAAIRRLYLSVLWHRHTLPCEKGLRSKSNWSMPKGLNRASGTKWFTRLPSQD
jgi:hypothetical protein